MLSSQCQLCKHYRGLNDCDAFPEGIPSEILTGRFCHTKPYPGDKGIRWEKHLLIKGDGREGIGIIEE